MTSRRIQGERPLLRMTADLEVGDFVHTPEGPVGIWTQIEDTHVCFFAEEPLLSLPSEGKGTLEVTRRQQVREENTPGSVQARCVTSGVLLPSAPRLVFYLVTTGNLPIRHSQWTLASAPPDEDPQLDRYPCLPASSICATLRTLWAPPPRDFLLQKC